MQQFYSWALILDVMQQLYSWALILDVMQQLYSSALILDVMQQLYSWALILDVMQQLYSWALIFLKHRHVTLEAHVGAKTRSISEAGFCSLYSKLSNPLNYAPFKYASVSPSNNKTPVP
jgi:hypothetical protein